MDAFVETAVEVSLLQVRQLDLAQQLLTHQGAIAGSVALWMAQRAGLSGREAKQLCRVAKRLPGLASIDEAFRAGRLSLDTADVLLKVATPANEGVLLETAGAATGAQLRKIIATFKRVRDHDQPEPDRHEELTYGCEDESMWMLRARLQPGHGAETETALRAAKEALWKSTEPGPEGKRPPVSDAEAFVHLCRAYLERTVTAAGVLPERYLTVVHVDLARNQAAAGRDGAARHADELRSSRAARRAHQRRRRRAERTRDRSREKREKREKRLGRAARQMRDNRERRERREKREKREGRDERATHASPQQSEARETLAMREMREMRKRREKREKRDGLGDSGAPSVIDAARVKRDRPDVGSVVGRPFDATNRDDVAWLRGIGAIDGNALERFLCDSVVSIVDQHGVDVTASAPVRLATPARRRALAAMHPTCQYPGCGRTQYLQAHHLVAYHPVTGPTALWNLVLVCDAHHDVLHEKGWSSALTDDHTLLVWRPNGSLVNSGALRAERPAATAAKTSPGGAAPEIDVTQRLHGVGERMDAWALDTYLHFWLESTAAAA